MATVDSITAITHTAQLYMMDVGSIVLCADGIAAQKHRDGWHRADGTPDRWSAPALLEHSHGVLAVLRWVAKPGTAQLP